MNTANLAGELEFMPQRKEQQMAGRPKIIREVKRSDTGTKRKTYNLNKETRGKTEKEPKVILGFWNKNNMDTMMQLSGQELDDYLEEWFKGYEQRQLKKDPMWWYPTPEVNTLAHVRNKRMKGVDKHIRIL